MTAIEDQALSVSAIKAGSVIDHIAPGSALKIIRLLQLSDPKTQVTLGLNLKSRSMGLKDLIKIENFTLTPMQISQIAIFAPKATVNVIEDYKVARKIRVQMPEAVASALRCPNPRCVTQSEPIATLFTVEENHRRVLLRCRYCEKLFSQDEVREHG